MSKHVKTLLITAPFIALLVAALLVYNALHEEHAPDSIVVLTDGPTDIVPTPASDISDTPAAIRETIPDFTLLDADGNTRQISEFFDKPIILNFWATWCPSCVWETPYFDALYQDHGGDVHVMKVNLSDDQRETREVVERFMDENGYSLPLYFDVNGAAAFGVRGIPITYFIEAGGYPVVIGQGPLNAAALQQGLEMILGGA